MYMLNIIYMEYRLLFNACVTAYVLPPGVLHRINLFLDYVHQISWSHTRLKLNQL